MHFKIVRLLSPALFRIMFGIHAFIPFIMQMHRLLPPRLHGWRGYHVFSVLFDWSDARRDRGLRNRMFQFASVYVSAESMRWRLGRECFARHKRIPTTRETAQEEDRVDKASAEAEGSRADLSTDSSADNKPAGATAWYDARMSPFALWACENDELVDVKRLPRRFEKGREPYVRVVHSKVIDGYEHLDPLRAMGAIDQVLRRFGKCSG
ncbi:hypothetical protein RJ55_03376 [Drechmeria coniospora]|nr:hypothetical protein RJ55_03376 [Drechmeria coniospora]